MKSRSISLSKKNIILQKWLHNVKNVPDGSIDASFLINKALESIITGEGAVYIGSVVLDYTITYCKRISFRPSQIVCDWIDGYEGSISKLLCDMITTCIIVSDEDAVPRYSDYLIYMNSEVKNIAKHPKEKPKEESSVAISPTQKNKKSEPQKQETQKKEAKKFPSPANLSDDDCAELLRNFAPPKKFS